MNNPPNTKRSNADLITWIVLGVLGVVCFSVLLPDLAPRWPPISLERPAQRWKVHERVRAAGGWEALRRDCLSLVEAHKDTGFRFSGGTNGLPPTIAALKPLYVIFYPSGAPDDGLNVSIVRIRVFGSHATGGHSTPYFGLEVAVGPEAAKYRPTVGKTEGAPGNSHSTYATITNNIYEIF